MSRGARLLVPLFGILLVIGGSVALLALHPVAREITVDALGLAFAFFTTPFVLETTCAALFLLGLLAYNRWRLHKEGDGWVWLMTRETENLPAKITQRLQSTILVEKPEPVDESRAGSGVIEGYLELGMPAQALQELDEIPAPLTPLDEVVLRVRVLAANLETDRATRLLRETAAADPGLRQTMAVAALDTARWLLIHLQREDLARHWLEEVGQLDSATRDAVPASDPLRRLL